MQHISHHKLRCLSNKLLSAWWQANSCKQQNRTTILVHVPVFSAWKKFTASLAKCIFFWISWQGYFVWNLFHLVLLQPQITSNSHSFYLCKFKQFCAKVPVGVSLLPASFMGILSTHEFSYTQIPLFSSISTKTLIVKQTIKWSNFHFQCQPFTLKSDHAAILDEPLYSLKPTQTSWNVKSYC